MSLYEFSGNVKLVAEAGQFRSSLFSDRQNADATPGNAPTERGVSWQVGCGFVINNAKVASGHQHHGASRALLWINRLPHLVP